MTRTVFLDTSAWLAVLSTREARHDEVAACYVALVRSGARLVTTNLVLAEVHALFVRRRGPREALQLLDALRDDPSHELVVADEVLHLAAVDRWLRRFADQAFSLTDAVSFEVMRLREIPEALALDEHFAVAGFRLLPPAPRATRRARSSRRR